MATARRLAALTLCLIVLPLGAEEAPPAEPEKLTDLRQAWLGAKQDEARPIRGKYLDALLRLEDKLTRAEKLGDALLVRNEIEILTQGALPLDSDESVPELDTLRGIFEREIDRVIDTNNRKYLDALRALQKHYSEDGELDAALAVEGELKRREALRDSKLAAIELIDPPRGLVIGDLEKGARRLSGRYQPPFANVAEELAGTQYTEVPWQSTMKVRVRVAHSGAIYAIPSADENLKTTGLNWTDAPGVLAGPYIKRVVKAQAREGHEFELNDFELCLIAREILLRAR